jgi:hypothetical protein
LPLNILCGVGVGFNSICNEMLAGVSDELVLRIARTQEMIRERAATLCGEAALEPFGDQLAGPMKTMRLSRLSSFCHGR